ncbi:hypothetical protein QAD02_014325 [Eretmocerus hayati]|uniref:Uncharacterized protein n=1 Tax=Eretmocerus hayati TaxID=131215 RepID=A0ACC2P5Z0_9HYME|nr:hypothetical protein QAD02_014325 [Eretmocerus hayati]
MEVEVRTELEPLRLEITLREHEEDYVRRKKPYRSVMKKCKEGTKRCTKLSVRTNNWTELKNRMKKGMVTRLIEEEDTDLRSSWEARGGEYYARRTDSRELIGNKRREEGERRIEEVLKGKSGKEFWEMMNGVERRRVGLSKNITKERWLEHFGERIRGQEEKSETCSKEDGGEEAMVRRR